MDTNGNLVLLTDDVGPDPVRRYALPQFLGPGHKALCLLGPVHPMTVCYEEMALYRYRAHYRVWIDTFYGRLTADEVINRMQSEDARLLIIEDLRCLDEADRMDALERITNETGAFVVARGPAGAFANRPYYVTSYKFPLHPKAAVPEAALLLDGEVAVRYSEHV